MTDVEIKSYDHSFAACHSCGDPAGWAMVVNDGRQDIEVPVCELHASRLTTVF